MKQVKVYKKEYEKLPVRFQKKLESDLNYLIKAKIPGLKKIYLFGSCARGEVRSSSDIDLLIVTKTQLMDMVKQTKADAVIVCMMKFCDPEEWDYPVYYRQLTEANIKSLMIEIDQEASSFEQTRTRVQSFVENC